MPRFSSWLIGLLLTVASTSFGAEEAITAEQVAFFENEVRPLLNSACATCHGAKKQESSLRVDDRESLLAGGESGPAIVPGDADRSLLIEAIRRNGPLKMPPDEPLTDAQQATLVAWIAQGAPWPHAGPRTLQRRNGEVREEDRSFWSWQPIKTSNRLRTETHEVDRWARGAIDEFIQARLKERHLHPSNQSDPLALLRRVTYDLTGLPPTLAEAQAFLKDRSPQAYERVVDRLLASPAYGERWGRHWLDVVRYADTAGETADYPVREAYRYRDYVIRSFQTDKPYDEFIREQVAGDILAHERPTSDYAELITATGYLAISRRFGFDVENYHYLTIQDTIDNLGQTFLGLTLGCARCHDHKFDPVSMADYYALYGIFESTRYAFPGSEQKQRLRAMVPLMPPAQSTVAWERYNTLHNEFSNVADRLKLAKPSTKVRSLDDLDGDFEIQAVSAGGSRGVLVPPWTYDGEPAITNAAQSPYFNLYRGGGVGVAMPQTRGPHQFAQRIHPALAADDHEQIYFNVDFRNAPASPEAPGSYRIALGDGPHKIAVEWFVTADAFFVRNGDRVDFVRQLKPGTWYNLNATISLRTRKFSGTIGEPQDVVAFQEMSCAPTFDGVIDYVTSDTQGHLAGIAAAHEMDNVGLRATPIARATAEMPSATVSSDQDHDAHLTELRQSLASGEIDATRAATEWTRLIERGPCELAYAVVEGTPRDVPLQKRGEPARLGDVIPRRYLSIFGGEPVASNGSGRRELAEWLVTTSKPLTARVMANRIWQYHFGRGLVDTPNDFGARGQQPSHPELLDYLAAELVDSGWSLKHLHRLILLSATYQQSSEYDRHAMEVDPLNELLWRFPHKRLEAEALRDTILAVSHTLDWTPGGPHPFPPMQQWGYTQHSPYAAVYESNHRRVYLMTQRLHRHPLLALFDGADTNTSTPKRSESIVPIQSLFMMNDPLVHDRSQQWARRLLAHPLADDERMTQVYWELFTRPPQEAELARGRQFLHHYAQQLHATIPEAADVDTQTWAAYLRTLWGTNEFLFLD